MLRYKIINKETIEVDLENDYIIIAMSHWDNAKQNYYVTLMLRKKNIHNWSLIEKAENIFLETNIKTLKRDMTMFVEKLYNEGFFSYYIERYEYEMKCFDYANELFEQRRLSESNV